MSQGETLRRTQGMVSTGGQEAQAPGVVWEERRRGGGDMRTDLQPGRRENRHKQ